MADQVLDNFLNVIERMDRLRNILWTLAAAIFTLGVLYANNVNALNHLGRENDIRKAEIKSINEARAKEFEETVRWREATSKALGRIEAKLED